jgi:uncharacterized protein YcbX
MGVFLSEIFIYPVKSFAGIALDASQVQVRGLKYDRRWMVVGADGHFLTQRPIPRMALVTPSISGTDLTLSAPGWRPLCIPLSLPPESPTTCVRVWRSECIARMADNQACSWISDFLDTPCRLVYMPEETRREVNPDYRAGEGIVSFADGYPLLLVGQESLDDLNSRLERPLPMNRFRPSIVVSGAGPFAEDHWKMIRVGDAVFHVVKPSARCVMTTVNQATGIPEGEEPLKTLAAFRLRDQNVFLGENLIPDFPSQVSVGDAVEVLQTRD